MISKKSLFDKIKSIDFKLNELQKDVYYNEYKKEKLIINNNVIKIASQRVKCYNAWWVKIFNA